MLGTVGNLRVFGNVRDYGRGPLFSVGWLRDGVELAKVGGAITERKDLATGEQDVSVGGWNWIID